MTGDQGFGMLYLLLCLVLVASALVGMRMPVGRAVKMLLAWVAIFGVAFALFTFRGEFAAAGARFKSQATGAPIVTPEEIRIAKSADGHFWVTASVNGRNAPFLVDSGASVTTITPSLAEAAGIAAGLRVATVETANGAVTMAVAKAERFAVGDTIRDDFTLHVSQQDDVNVLGMNFLSSLAGWRVDGNLLVLRP